MRIEEKGGDLVIVDFNEFEAFKIARRIETDGIHFYQKLLERSSDEKVKETLPFLLDEEKGHQLQFEKLLSELEQKKEDEFEEEGLLSGFDYGIFQPYQDIDQLDKILDTPSKALKLGFIVEDKTIKFYEVCKEHVMSDETKKAFDRIIEEEKKHKSLLEDMSRQI